MSRIVSSIWPFIVISCNFTDLLNVFFKAIKTDSGIECEPCDGRGWLICDFCKGEKTNVKSETNRIYRRCPSCRAVSIAFSFWLFVIKIYKVFVKVVILMFFYRLVMYCVPSARFSNVLLSQTKVMAKTEEFLAQGSICILSKWLKRLNVILVTC